MIETNSIYDKYPDLITVINGVWYDLRGKGGERVVPAKGGRPERKVKLEPMTLELLSELNAKGKDYLKYYTPQTVNKVLKFKDKK